MNTRSRDALRIAIVVAASILLVCLLLEVLLRLAAHFSGRYALAPEAREARTRWIVEPAPDPELIYTLRPNYVKDGVRYTESHGILRSEDVSAVKPARTLRVAVIGDSIAAGLGIQEQYGGQPFPEQLEDLLQSSLEPQGIAVEVLNFGTDGYGTLQEARLLETRVQRFSPDLVVLEFCFNDVGNSFTPTFWFMDPRPPSIFLYSFVMDRLGLSRPAGPLDPLPTQYVPDTGPVVSQPEVVAHWRRLYAPGGPGRGRLSAGFRRIAAAAGRLGAPVTVVMFPLLTGDEGDSGLLQEMRAVVVAEIREKGFHLVDLSEPFSRVAIETIRENHPQDHFHPGPVGHAIAARALSAFILKNFDGGIPRH